MAEIRQSLERRRRALMAFVQRVQRSGPFVITIDTNAECDGEFWPLIVFSEAIELALDDGLTGCDLRYNEDGGALTARFLFRAHAAPDEQVLERLRAVVRGLSGAHKAPRFLAAHPPRTSATILRVDVRRLTDAEHQDEQERARQQYSRIDAEIDAQISALPADTVQEDRDRKLLASARAVITDLAKRETIVLGTLAPCETVLRRLDTLDGSHLGMNNERYAQMVLVACAVYVGDLIAQQSADVHVHLRFNESQALREVELIDASGEENLRILRLLTLCMKHADGSGDLRTAVDSWLRGGSA